MPPKKELTGQKYGKLTVLRESGRDKFGKTLWACICECGKEITVIGEGLTRGFTKGCPNCKIENLVGQKFGKLIVLEKTAQVKGHAKYKCLCECGKESIVNSQNLKRGKTKSCGCGEIENLKNNWAKVTTHGLTDHPIHNTWNAMKGRCYNKKNEKYKNYGARGIIVCDEWKDNFQAFYDWAITSGWQEGLTIDRENNDGHYEPSNCRWANDDIQANNKTTNLFITFNGETKTATQWAKTYNIPSYTIAWRFKRGWPIEKVFLKKIA